MKHITLGLPLARRLIAVQLIAGQIAFASATADAKPVPPTLSKTDPVTQTVTTVLRPEHWLSGHFVDHPLVGTVWRGRGQRTSWTALSDALHDAISVLVGEVHTNRDHHMLQSRVVEVLAQLGRKPVVVWEMIPEDKQSLLDSPRLTTAKAVRALAKELNWSTSGWPEWSMYEPIALAAVAYGLPMRGVALDRKLLRDLARNGYAGLSLTLRTRLHLSDSLSDADNHSMLNLLDKGHCGLIPRASLAPMQWVQRARDGAMADAMLRIPQNTQGAVLIAGNGHVRKDWGVPALLIRSSKVPAADDAILAIAQIEVSETAIDPTDYVEIQTDKPLYDFVVFTPRSEIKDHCARLRKRFKR